MLTRDNEGTNSLSSFLMPKRKKFLGWRKSFKRQKRERKKKSLNVKNLVQNEKWRIIYMQRATALRTFHLISSSCCSLSFGVSFFFFFFGQNSRCIFSQLWMHLQTNNRKWKSFCTFHKALWGWQKTKYIDVFFFFLEWEQNIYLIQIAKSKMNGNPNRVT